MQRREFLAGLASTFSLTSLNSGRGTTKIAFGSCAVQTFEQPIWNKIGALNPNAMVMLGDNIYADTLNMNHMASCYRQFASIPEFAKFRRKFPVLATWDDHDYGWNDAGADYPKRAESKRLFLDFFKEPITSPRRHRPGVYTSYTIGQAPNDVQILLLDLRWFRSPLNIDKGEYRPSPDPRAQFLGEEQWRWLESELRKPAGARIIGSSIQMVSSEHRWEKWANYPIDKLRLERLLESLDVRNAVVISGDMHFGEISAQRLQNGFELVDFTSSGLSHYDPATGLPNSNRVALFDRGLNFGMISVDWERSKITGEIFDGDGRLKAALDVPIPLRMIS
jgi:alkaline phosphatase D